MTPEVFDRAQQLLSFLKETDLFKASHWTHNQFKDDVAVFPEFEKHR